MTTLVPKSVERLYDNKNRQSRESLCFGKETSEPSISATESCIGTPLLSNKQWVGDGWCGWDTNR